MKKFQMKGMKKLLENNGISYNNKTFTGRERATARSRGIRSVSAPAPSSRPGEKTSVTESGISFISSDKTTAHEKAGF